VLPLADCRAHAFQMFGFEGTHGASWLAKASGLTNRVGRERATAHCGSSVWR
jgi:hypothetical protein